MSENNPKYDYVPIVAIFAKLTRDLGLDQVDESDVIEWAGEALEAIGAVPMYEPAVAFMEVRNHQAEIPNGTLIIDGVARNNCWNAGATNNLCPADVLRDIKDTLDVSCTDANNPCKNSLPIPLDCNGQPVMDYTVAYYRPYYDLLGEYYGWNWSSSRINQKCFNPVRLNTNTFGFATDCAINGNTSMDIAHSAYCGTDEYVIIRGTNKRPRAFRFNFKDGQVAVSYKRQAIDEETGYPLIPDTFSHKTAIVKYITMMMDNRDFRKGREGAKSRLDESKADWTWYCGQAGNLDMMLRGVDEHQNFYDQRTRLLPNNKQYYSFFGKMSVPEGRKFDDPDHRNYSVSFFRGTGGYAF